MMNLSDEGVLKFHKAIETVLLTPVGDAEHNHYNRNILHTIDYMKISKSSFCSVFCIYVYTGTCDLMVKSPQASTFFKTSMCKLSYKMVGIIQQVLLIYESSSLSSRYCSCSIRFTVLIFFFRTW